MEPAPVRIVIADANQLYRKTLSAILHSKPNLHVVAGVEDGVAAIQAVCPGGPQRANFRRVWTQKCLLLPQLWWLG